VGQQVADRDRALERGEAGAGRHRLRRRPARRERRDGSSNGVVESQPACLDQPERGDPRDRLRHRGDPEDRVGLDRQIGVDVAPTDAVDLERLVAASHERDGPAICDRATQSWRNR
jgi:hypothetical protein